MKGFDNVNQDHFVNWTMVAAPATAYANIRWSWKSIRLQLRQPFFYQTAVQLWNRLPTSVVQASSFVNFKKRLDKTRTRTFEIKSSNRFLGANQVVHYKNDKLQVKGSSLKWPAGTSNLTRALTLLVFDSRYFSSKSYAVMAAGRNDVASITTLRMATNSQPIAGLARPLVRATATSNGCHLSPSWVTVGVAVLSYRLSFPYCTVVVASYR